MSELSEIHDCEKCHDKMVCIEVDLFGNTYCAYCHQRVDYSKVSKSKEFLEFLEKQEKFNMRYENG